MKPAPFDYYAPTTVDEAVGLLAEFGEDGKVLAGGQSLVPMLNLRLTQYAALVDLGRVAALRAVDIGPGGVTVGAMVAQCDVEESDDIAAAAPLLAAATPLIGHFQIRSRGTVGGSISHADPAAEYPAVALALDAEIGVDSTGGHRVVPAADFFTGTWSTALRPEDLLTSVRFPTWGSGSGFAIEEVARRHGDFAIAGACVAIHLSGGKVERAAVALFGMDSTPIRARAAESALRGATPEDVDAAAVAREAIAGLDPPEDLHASSALRRTVGATVVTRAIHRALEQAQRG